MNVLPALARSIWLIAVFTSFEVSAFELAAPVYQPSMTFFYGMPQDGRIKVIDVDMKALETTSIYQLGINLEVPAWTSMALGMVMVVDLPSETVDGDFVLKSAAEAKAIQFGGGRLGFFTKYIFGDFGGFSPFAKVGLLGGVSLGAAVGNSLRGEGELGITYYLTEFFGIDAAFGYGAEATKLFVSDETMKGIYGRKDVKFLKTESVITIGLRSNIW